jgi:AcrR family transcriptional regulator
MATPVKRPTGRDEILDAVLDAAERLCAAAGPVDVSLRAIAQEAGVNYGLVHRHFGTKDELFDRLLQRVSDRWMADREVQPAYDAAMHQLLGPNLEAGPYLRLLAWTLLSEQDRSADAHRRHAKLDRLLSDEPGAALDTAAALAFVFGWRLFNPFITAALHLDDMDPAELHAAMHARLDELLAG